MTGPLTLVIGGCRSGKSRHALALAEGYPGTNRVFLATCEPKDDEMRRRVARHRAERGARWRTEEAPLDLSGAVRRWSAAADVVIVDCLTLWVSNRMLKAAAEPDTASAARSLAGALSTAPCPIVAVSNEVGTGIVPENPLAREYRDAVGTVNRIVAGAADAVIWMVAGIPVPIKGAPA